MVSSALVMIPPQSYIGWKVSVLLLHAVAIGSTIYRLAHRFRIHRVWWDDYLVFLPLLCNTVYCILTWIRFNRRVPDSTTGSWTYQVLSSFWLSFLPYLLTIWSTRMALSLSLGRIFPNGHPSRRWSYFLVAVMAVSFIGCTLVSVLSCRYKSSLMVLYQATYCARIVGNHPVWVVVFLVATAFSDLLLFISPLVVFRRAKLTPEGRRLVLVVFCGSSLTLLWTITVVIFITGGIFPGVDYRLITAGLFNTAAAGSLFSSNLTVISTCLYQALCRLRNRATIVRQVTTRETPERSPCTCVVLSNHSSTLERLTLTEISTFSSQSRHEEYSHSRSDASVI